MYTDKHQDINVISNEPNGNRHSGQSNIIPEYLNARQVAQLTGFSLRSLEAMRAKRVGPAYIKLGAGKNGSVRYCLADVREWLNKHREVTADAE